MKRYLPYAFIAVCITLLLRNTIGSGFPNFFENYGSYMSQVLMLQKGWFTENWYFGYDIARFYPPMTTVGSFLLGTMLGDVSLAFNLIAYMAYVGTGMGLYHFLRREGLSVYAALVAVGLFVTSHVVIRGAQGFYWEIPHLVGFSLLPLLLLSLRAWLRNDDSRYAAVSGVIIGLMLLNNILAFTEALLVGLIYIVTMQAGSIKRTRRTLGQLVIGTLCFIAVTGWWLVPAVFPDGLGAYTKTEHYALSGLVRLIGSAKQHDNMFLLSLLSVPGVFAIAGAIAATRKPHRIDWFAAVLFVVSLTLVVIHFMQGWRFLVDVTLALSILSGRFIDRVREYRVSRASLVSGALAVVAGMHVLSVAITSGVFDISVSREKYKETVIYRAERTVYDLMEPEDVVYIQYADQFHGGPMAFNLFFPDRRQVGGGFFAGNRNPDVDRIKDYVRSGESAEKLDQLLRSYGVTYLLVNREQLLHEGSYNSLQAAYPVVAEHEYMVVLFTGYRSALQPISYTYFTAWRLSGLVLSFVAGLACAMFRGKRL